MATSTISWMISFIGPEGANRADIIREGAKAGHHPATLRLYLGSASLFGHVDPEFCTTESGRVHLARRPVYFNRRRKAHYTLSPGGMCRLNGIIKADFVAENPVKVCVKAAEAGYNGSTMQDSKLLQINPSLLEALEGVFGDGEDTAKFELEMMPKDAGMSYEDTYYLTVTCHYSVEGRQVRLMTEKLMSGARFTRPEVTIYCGEEPGVVCLSFAMWTSEARNWEAPVPKAPEPRHDNLDVGQY